jgi:UDP-N-acetylmuramate dehydrogenase
VTVERIADELRGRLRGTVQRDVPLARFTTYRIGGPAALYVEPADVGDVEVVGRALRRGHTAGSAVPVLALGRGSNVVVSDAGWPGVAIRLGSGFSGIRPAGEGGLEAGAATSMPLLANWAARRELAGMEFAIAIPGSVGGGVRMNAGAHGAQVGDRLESVLLYVFDRLEVERRPGDDLELAYRSSNLTENELVLGAHFGLEHDDAVAIRARMDAYRRHRAETQPGAVQNAGSVFKNPPGDWAGRLVEAAGLKGYRLGGAAVSELHANFFVADEGTRAQEVYDLVQSVRELVSERFGVLLEPEIRFMGAFERRAATGGTRR